MGCNGRNFQELPPDWNCHLRVGCNGLQWEEFSGITPWLKLPCMSGLQWAAMGGIFRNYPTHDWNCHVRVGCNGLQWEDFSGFSPLPLIETQRGYNDGRVGLPRGVERCKSEGVICSEGVKWCKSRAAKGGKMVKEWGGNLFRGGLVM